MNFDWKSFYLINVYFQFWTVTETQGQPGFCAKRKPVVRICNDGELFAQSRVFIDTARVPKYQQSSCECTISPANGDVQLAFQYLDVANVSKTKNIQFEINGIVLNGSAISKGTVLNGETKLAFSTTKHFSKEGVCLVVATDPRQFSSSDVYHVTNYFNISCAKQTSRAVRSNIGTPTSTAVSIVLSVTGILLLISGAVILLFIVTRYRLAKKTVRNGCEHPTSSSDYPSQCQGRGTYVSGTEHYLAMSGDVCKGKKNENRSECRSSFKSLKTRQDDDTYEMVCVSKTRQVQNLIKGKGQEQKNTRSHIYESMHVPLDFRRSSKIK